MNALRQCLAAAVAWGDLERNPAVMAGPNPQGHAEEVIPFTEDELDSLRSATGTWRHLVTFASETGLRPCEWIALEVRDVRRDEGVVLVERSVNDGMLARHPKTDRSRRRVLSFPRFSGHPSAWSESRSVMKEERYATAVSAAVPGGVSA